jgi:hypothetical protein
MTLMQIQRILSIVVVVLWVILLALMAGRYRQGQLAPEWLRAASKSNFLWVTLLVLGLLASVLKLLLL